MINKYIGLDFNIDDYYNRIKQLDVDFSSSSYPYLKFISNIPLSNDTTITNNAEKILFLLNSNLFKDNFFNINSEIIVKSFESYNIFHNTNNFFLNSVIKENFGLILNLYIKNESNLNFTKLKNFILKLILWINSFVPMLIPNFCNSKVFYIGNIKKHEIYFLIFLSKLGCDVFYFNSPNDSNFSLIDKNKEYTRLSDLPNKTIIDIDTIKNILLKNDNTKSSNLNSNYKNSITSLFKKSSNIFNDVLLPLNNRGEFVGSPKPLIPNYFYRYIGFNSNKESYYNSLYNLNKSLEKFSSLYVLFENNIPIENNTVLLNETKYVFENKNINLLESDSLINSLCSYNGFPDLREEIINSSIIKNFKKIFELYLAKESSTNSSKTKNFILKILIWIHKYIPNLFKNFDYVKSSNTDAYNPKVVYYGQIKKHEIYFLIFLSLMGCDILYINSKNDLDFSSIDTKYSTPIIMKNFCPINDFPKEETILRYETTAFKSSCEIENILYNENDGMFKPWQFEDYSTSPITLKTTYEEFKILWNEEARMRPGFKIKNNTVYIPNIFAKISGVHNDLNIYWNDFKALTNNTNIVFFDTVPYSKINYSNYDFYSLEYCFKNENLNKEALLNHKLYNYSYLKTSLQNVIIEKICLLLKLPILKCSIDSKFKLKVLITILNLNSEILNMIQKFDYPFNIPKIIIYHNNKNLFCDEDCITLAFLNLLGFDIAIFTPTGYNNIESLINGTYYDTYKLENILFDLTLPNLNCIKKSKDKSNSFWSNLFK